MSKTTLEHKEKADKGETIEYAKTKQEEFEEDAASKYSLSEMKTFLLIPHEMPTPDPEWITKKFAGEKLNADEIDQYLMWKQKQKLKRFKKIINAPGMGHFEKVHRANQRMKVKCEVGSSCMGWNHEVYDGIFGRCGQMDPFIVWK